MYCFLKSNHLSYISAPSFSNFLSLIIWSDGWERFIPFNLRLRLISNSTFTFHLSPTSIHTSRSHLQRLSLFFSSAAPAQPLNVAWLSKQFKIWNSKGSNVYFSILNFQISLKSSSVNNVLWLWLWHNALKTVEYLFFSNYILQATAIASKMGIKPLPRPPKFQHESMKKLE